MTHYGIFLGKLMLTENDGKHPAAYYAHRVETLEIKLNRSLEEKAELRGDITALHHKVNQLTTQVTTVINRRSG